MLGRTWSWSRRLALAVTAIVVTAVAAHADPAGTIKIRLAAGKATGAVNLEAAAKGGDAKVVLTATNEDPQFDVVLRLPPCTFDQTPTGVIVPNLEDILTAQAKAVGTPPTQDVAWAACVDAGKPLGVFVVRRGETVKIKVSIDFRALGNQHVRLFFDVFTLGQEGQLRLPATTRPSPRTLEDVLRSAGRAAIVPFSLFYAVELDGRQRVLYRLAKYEDLFFVGHPTVEDQGEGMTTRQYTDGTLPVALDDYLTLKQVVPDVTYDPQHADVLRVATDTLGPDPDDCDCVPPTRHDCTAGRCDTQASATAPLNPRGTTFTIKGRYSAKWTDHTLHPAWGWVAVAWWNNGGTWTKLASDWVTWDGSYTLTVDHAGYSGQNLRMQFRAYNRYFEPRDGDDNTFRWRNPDRTNISSNHNEGHWYADCDGTTVNGLGEVYYRGYQLWSEMYWRGGINPIRADPLKVYYPNTTYDCGDGSGVPWSCANVGGTIWLIASHGLQRDVMQHEMGHQVNNEFHDNKRPAGAGGSHSLTSCYNQGKALREGYADFMPYWIQANRSSVPTTAISGFNIEAPGSGYCKTPGENNEVWVAATFWDLHDSAADGNDVLWFNNQGAAHAIYLAHPPANDGDSLGMSDYRTYYRNAASDGHEGYVDDIFEQNDTD